MFPFNRLLPAILFFVLTIQAGSIQQTLDVPIFQKLEYDYLIVNAQIIDGRGSGAYKGNILIDDGLIVRTGDFNFDTLRVKKIIDAAGRSVTPGFVDTHSHGDPLITPRFDNFLSMGVTTISLGQDGTSPLVASIGRWMQRVDSVGTGPNIIHFTGHATLRNITGLTRQASLEPSESNALKSLLNDAMADGSFGLTTGLEYEAGRYTTPEELSELAAIVAENGGLIMSHLRSEDDDKIESSILELISQGSSSGAPVHISHLKIVYANKDSRADSVLQLINSVRNSGVKITADLYPYTASYTGIGIVFPDWVTMSNFDRVKNERRIELERYLRDRILKRNGPEATLFGTGEWTGMTLSEVSDSLNKPFEDVLIDDIGPSGAGAAYLVMNEDVMKRFLQDPHVMISSDGSPTMYHPRGYGSFAKVIDDYVNEEEVLPLEKAIWKMTGLPAETLGLSDPSKVNTPRGLLKKGFAADLLIFDHTTVKDIATYQNPHQFAEGMDWVFVNGEPVIEKGVRNSERPGGIIRKNVR